MDRVISLVERILVRGQKLIHFGKLGEGKKLLLNLLSFGDVPTEKRREAHGLLADLYLEAGLFKKARRHLTAAITLNPLGAEGYFELAQAIERDPEAKQGRAWKLLRKATRLKPDQPRYWVALGQLSLRLNRTTAALSAFRRAIRLEPGELKLVSAIFDGLMSLDRGDVAQEFLVNCRFRLGRNSGFEAIWKKFRFLEARRDQQSVRWDEGDAPTLSFEEAQRDFVASASDESGTGEILRHDRFSTRHVHLPRLLSSRPGPRNAP
jgi:tetratricopeptide (TPR) repeat protein